MASTLLELRRQAGYKTAKEFAEHIGVPVPTYTRYEANPEKIPLKAAWSLADELGCSIDAVVDRNHVEDAEAMKGEVQRAYEALSRESKKLMDEFMEFLKSKDEVAKRQREDAMKRRFEDYARYYERQFLLTADEYPKLADATIFGTPAERREAFGTYVALRCAETRTQRMAAYLDDEEIVDYCAELGLGTVDDKGHFEPGGKATTDEQKRAKAELDELLAEIEARVLLEDNANCGALLEAYDRIHALDMYLPDAPIAGIESNSGITHTRKEDGSR